MKLIMENWKRYINENIGPAEGLINAITEKRKELAGSEYADMTPDEISWFQHWSGQLLSYFKMYEKLKKRNKSEKAEKYLNQILDGDAKRLGNSHPEFVDSPEKAKHDYHFEKYIPEALPFWKEITTGIEKGLEIKIK